MIRDNIQWMQSLATLPKLIVSIVVVLVCLVVLLLLWTPRPTDDDRKKSLETQPQREAPPVEPSPAARSQSFEKAPTVLFSDGGRASVDLSVSFHVAPADAPLVISSVGSIDKVKEVLQPQIIGTVLAVLEPLSLTNAREHRGELERNIEDQLRPSFRKIGITLDRFSLREFTLQ